MKKFILLLLSLLLIAPAAQGMGLFSCCKRAKTAQKEDVIEQTEQIEDPMEYELNKRFYAAVQENDYRKAEECLIRGANPDITEGDYGCPAIMEAVMHRNEKMCQLLLAYGADVQLKFASDYNAIDLAAVKGLSSICKTLITQATFDRRRSNEEILESQDLVMTFLLSLNRIFPKFKDIRYHVLTSTQYWRRHVYHCAFGIHRNHPERTPSMPISVVKTLIAHELIQKEKAIDFIAARTITTIKPLLADALPMVTQKTIREIIDPKTYQEQYGDQIRKFTAQRLE